MLRIVTNWRLYAFPWLLVLGACRTGEEPKPAQDTRAVQEAPGFPARLLKEALAEVDLTSEQRSQVDLLIQKTQSALATTRQARAALLREVATSVRSGAPEEARIRAKATALKAAFEQVRPTLATHLNQLHAQLDGAQRQALVTALRTRLEAHAKAHAGDGPHGMGGHRGPPRFLRRLAEELGISPAQRQAIHDRIHSVFPGHGKRFHARRGEMKKHLDALAAAFVAEGFDAHKIDLPGPHQHHGELLDKAFGFGRTLLPLLSATQREKLATHLEERAQRLAEGQADE